MNEDAFFSNVSDAARFLEAIGHFDELNAADPNCELDGGATHAREWLNARRLSGWVMRLAPDASEVLRLASRCQHLCRWKIPRSRYEMTRAGYHQWRNELKKFHAEQSAKILREAGYDEETIARVQALNLKKNFPGDPESRVLEDALCLVFLQFQFSEFAAKTERDKIINALRKSWKKMTPAAHAHALSLAFGERERALVEEALRD